MDNRDLTVGWFDLAMQCIYICNSVPHKLIEVTIVKDYFGGIIQIRFIV